MRLHRIVFVALVASGSGCVSPGHRYDTVDLRFLTAPSAAPAQPTTAQTATISFTLFDTSVKHPMSGVHWIAYVDPTIPPDPATPVDPTTGAVVDQGDVDVPADGTVTHSFPAGAVAPGIHRYYIVARPAAGITERDSTNDTESLTVATADLDVAFASTPSFPNPNIDLSGNVVMQFSLINNPNAGLADPTTGPTANVTFIVYEGYVSAASPGTVVTPVGGTPQPIVVAPQATVPVTVTLPSAAGPHAYTVVFTTTGGLAESNVANDVSTVTVSIGTGG